jgi:hypothetical protein
MSDSNPKIEKLSQDVILPERTELSCRPPRARSRARLSPR